MVSRSGLVKYPPLIRLVAGCGYKNLIQRDSRNRSQIFPYVKGNKKGADLFGRTYLFCFPSPLPKDDLFDGKSTGKGRDVCRSSLNFIPAGVFLLWAFQKSLSRGEKALVESLSVKECKICFGYYQSHKLMSSALFYL